MNRIAHARDPESSRLAAEEMDRSGRRQAHKNLVADLCRRFPGSTAIELWEHATPWEQAELKEPQEVRRRLTDLFGDGRVTQEDVRECRIRKTKMVTWRVGSAVRAVFVASPNLFAGV